MHHVPSPRRGACGSPRRRGLLLAAGAAALAAPHARLRAAPSSLPGTISLVVGFPPGGPNDLIARLLAPLLSEQVKHGVLVENRSGADGELGAAAVAHGPVDGSMLLFASAGALTISPAIKKDLPYAPLRDFAPIARVASSPMVMVTNTARPYKTAADVIAAARRSPGKLTYASGGTGSPTHLAGALFCDLAHVNMLHIPYRGGGPALTDLLGGQVELYFAGVSTALPLIQSGKLRAIGVTGAAPLDALPGIPPLGDTPELSGYSIDNWYGVLAPAKMPAELVTQLADAIEASLKNPELRKKFEAQGVEPALARERDFGAIIGQDLAKWQRVAGSLNISV